MSAETDEVTPAAAQHIHQALVAVGAELAKVGISKDRKNEQQNFRFRGIDDVMNVVSPILAKHEVVFLVDYEDYPDVERVTGKGTTLIYTKVRGTFRFLSARDGSELSVSTFGVAMDSGDKACNKAMSAALKYALLQTFLIPTESNEDADSTTHEPSVVKPPVGFDEWYLDITAVADEGFDAIREAWKNSKEDFRDYTLKYRAGEWAATKKRAIAVTEHLKAEKRETAAAAKTAKEPATK